MHIDVIIATHNRSVLLRKAVESILSAQRSEHFDFTITVVDNNSTDDTRRMIAELAVASNGKVRYLFERRQGKSHAINSGIIATFGEIIAFADDDQTMGDQWLCAICRAFNDGYDYVTGPVYGVWEVDPPEWYDGRLQGVISTAEYGDHRIEHDRSAAIEGLSGGNGAVRRAAIRQVGGLHPLLGKTPGGFTMCEDGELSIRLRSSGYRGVYEPQMQVFHRVPRERLKKSYFRRWHLGYGRSIALIDSLHPAPVSYWLCLPRFLIRRTLEAMPKMIAARRRGDQPGSFEQELNLWFMFGFIAEKLADRAPQPAPSFESMSEK